MDDVHESDPEAGAAAAPGPTPGDPRSRPAPSGRAGTLFGLPRRTLAICVVIAAIGALVAGLVASVVLTDDPPADDAAPEGVLEAVAGADPEAMLAVALTTVDGEPTTLAARLDGRPLVVNLWAQSCAPCIEEMPLLEAAHQENPDIGFLGVHVNDPYPADQLEKATALAEQTGITFPWVQDPDRTFFFEAKAAGMPTTLFLDARGRILGTKTGAFTDASDLQSWIDEHTPT